MLDLRLYDYAEMSVEEIMCLEGAHSNRMPSARRGGMTRFSMASEMEPEIWDKDYREDACSWIHDDM